MQTAVVDSIISVIVEVLIYVSEILIALQVLVYVSKVFVVLQVVCVKETGMASRGGPSIDRLAHKTSHICTDSRTRLRTRGLGKITLTSSALNHGYSLGLCEEC